MFNYYASENIIAFPTSNSTDQGKLTLEENMSAIVTRITNRNYVLTDDDFNVTISNNSLVISPGKCNIAGFDIRTDASKIIEDKPDSYPFEGWLCMKLSFDGSGHVRGDVEDGMYVSYEGLYITYISDESEIDQYTLVLGSVKWDGTNLEFKRNPDITHRLDASDIGAKVDLKVFDLNGPDVEGTDTSMNLQQYILNVPDWYVSKFGDFMIGNLLFDIGGYVYNNDENKGEFVSRRNCGSLLIGDTDYNGLSFNSIVPRDNDIYLKLGANSDRFSGIELGGHNGNVLNTVSIGYTSGASNVFNIRYNSVAANTYTGYITFSDGSIDIHGNGQITISGHNSTSANDNITINTLNNKVIFHTVVSNTDHSHVFGYDATGLYPYYSLGTLTISTGDNGLVQLVNSSNTINILPSVTTNDLFVNKSIVVGTEANGVVIDSSGIDNSVSGNVINRIDNQGVYSTVGVGASTDIDSPFASTSRYTKLYRDTITLNTSQSGTSYIYFNSSGFNKVALSNKGDSNILNLSGNFVASGTITGSRVYNAVYNDYAEWYEKDDINEEFKPGDVIELNPKTGKYRKSSSTACKFVVGVCSDTYGIIVGGDNLENMKDNSKKFIPVGISGRVYTKVIGEINPGDLLTSSIDGYAMKVSPDKVIAGTIIGKALERSMNGKVLMQIMLG